MKSKLPNPGKFLLKVVFLIFHFSLPALNLVEGFIVHSAYAQTPQAMSYQAVIRDIDDELIRDQKVKVRVTILQGSEDGRSVFVETHDATTNRNGLISLIIGEGTPEDGSLHKVDWAEGSFFVRTETDPRGGTDYSITGTTRLLSVPYALYAARSGSGYTNGAHSPGTVVVDAQGNGDFLTITGALKNINPTEENPYTVFIRPGEYVENIALISNVVLQGTHPNGVFIKGFFDNANNEFVVKIEDVNNVRLQSITITSRDNNAGQPSGIMIKNADVIFQNVNILGDREFFVNPLHDGIVAENATIDFEGGRIIELERKGVILINSIARIRNSELMAPTYPIEVETGSYLELTGSRVSNGVHMVLVNPGGRATLTGNQFFDSGIRNDGTLTMTGNRVYNSYDIGLSNYGKAIVTSNIFSGCQVMAIADNGLQGTSITGNIFENTGPGGAAALVLFNPNATVSSNIFHNNPFGDIRIASDLAGLAYVSANQGAVTGTGRRGRMAGIDDMFIERNNSNMLLVLPEGGNLGMGTAQPTAPLHIVDGTANIRLGSNLEGIKTRLSFTDTSNQDTYIEKLDQGRLRFRVGGTNTRMTITPDGNVGIGTQSPTTRFHTTGDVRLQGLEGEGSRIVVADNAGNLSAIKLTYQVGDFAHGGVVFNVEPCGTRGLVVAIEDQSTGVKWNGGGKNYYTMATGDGVYAGKMNTSIIISVHSAKDDFDLHAALVCANYSEGGFGDWYLPSKEELNLMYQNKTAIDASAVANGGTSFASAHYWSSTERVGETFLKVAWLQSFANGNQNAFPKDEPYRVRAIRAF